ncbi:hypothetical protein JK217_15250 [Gluconobacter kondonii]|uniref:hypothetical protein n=1 Tax=Gluconobacter kondonii TaxID=941463 RepID=UPI001B8BEAFC|nr:hypothetical protein [Gluconobacter kondonii]MBS1079042.1 hypothetical protein [Gluconobacter kondonii]
MKNILYILTILFTFETAKAQTYQKFDASNELPTSTKIGNTSQTLGNITSLANAALPASNGTRTGGSDTGTDVSGATANGVKLRSAIKDCFPASPNVFYGATNSSSDMANASNTVHLRASGNVLPYFNEASIGAVVYGGGADVNDIAGVLGMSGMQNIIKTTGVNGIIELNMGKYMTPSVPSSYWQNLLDVSGNVINDVDMIQKTGFKPTVATLNFVRDWDTGVDKSDKQYYTDNDLNNFQIVSSNIKENIPSVTGGIWPYVVPDANHLLSTDAYWENVRKALTIYAGGVGIDIPAGNYVLNGPSSMAPIIDEIKWANANGVKSLVLLSPYSTTTPAGYGYLVVPQWRYDEHFLYHVKTFVSWLQAAGALPSGWSIVNYGPVQYWNPVTPKNLFGIPCTGCERITPNLMGSDDDITKQTVASVARWVAENAPTSTYTSMPNMNQTSAVCTATVLSDYKSSKPVISAGQLGLGSLAYQDYDKTILSYPTLFGAEVSGGLNYVGKSGNTYGSNTSNPVYEYFSFTDSMLHFSGSDISFDNRNIFANGTIWSSNNISFLTNATGTNGIQFQAKTGTTANSWLSGDGSGGITLGKGAYSRFNGTLELHNYRKTEILSISNPSEGQIVNDITDHVPVIYENGAWYPLIIGTALGIGTR